MQSCFCCDISWQSEEKRGGGLSQTRQVDRDCEKVRKMKEKVRSSNKQWIIIVIKAAVKKKRANTLLTVRVCTIKTS